MKRYRPHTMTGWTKKMEESWLDHRVQGQGKVDQSCFHRLLVRSINFFHRFLCHSKSPTVSKSFFLSNELFVTKIIFSYSLVTYIFFKLLYTFLES